MTLPLEGVRILAVEQFGAAPYGTMLLANLGAEVIKIENAAAGGDPSRSVGPYFLGQGDSLYFQSWNLSKKSVLLDLKTDGGRLALETLARGAHALVNNLRGDQPAKLGLDYASLAKVNPALVCLHISAYGRDNERAGRPGYDFLMQAEAGLMSLTGEPEGPPTRFGTSIIDAMTGVIGALGLLSAIWWARETGKGCDVDTCLFDVALAQLNYAGTWYLNEGLASSRQARGAHLALTPVQTFPTADGWVFITCMTERFWQALAKSLDRPELLDDARFKNATERLRNRSALTGILDEVFRKHPTSHWLAKLEPVLPIGPVYDLAQALDNPFVKTTGMVQTIAHPQRKTLKVLAPPFKIDGQRPMQKPARPLGADNHALLGAALAAAAAAR